MPTDTLLKIGVAADDSMVVLVDDGDQLRRRLTDLGPFWNLDRHPADSQGPSRGNRSPVFYGDLAPGVRVELTIPDEVTGLSAESLLMPRPDGGWEVFGSHGLLAEYGADAVRVSVRRRLESRAV